MIHEIRADGLWLLKAWSILEQPRQELANDMDGSTRLPSRQAHCRSHPCRPYHLLSLGLTQISSFQPESSKRELSVSAWGAARTSSQSAMFVFDHSYYHNDNNNSSSNNQTKQQQLLLVLPVLNTAIITIAPALMCMRSKPADSHAEPPFEGSGS